MKKVWICCAIVLIAATGCVKELFDKDEDEPKGPEKFAAVWRFPAVAIDQDDDQRLDASERTTANGTGVTSEINLKADLTYTYFLNVSGERPLNRAGNWTLAPDERSLMISDNTGDTHFTIQSDTELHTEPIFYGRDRDSALWLIYTR